MVVMTLDICDLKSQDMTTPRPALMAQESPALDEPSSQHLPPILRLQPAQEPVLPLPFAVRRLVVLASNCEADLHWLGGGDERHQSQ